MKPFPAMSDYAVTAYCLLMYFDGKLELIQQDSVMMASVCLTPFIAGFFPEILWIKWLHLGYDMSNFYFANSLVWNAMLLGLAYYLTWKWIKKDVDLTQQTVFLDTKTWHK